MSENKYYNLDNKLTSCDIASELLRNFGKEKPIIVCLGSSKVLSDMVGVFVADILKQRNVDAIVFGGNKRNVNKSMCKLLSKYIDSSRLLFVDSAVSKKNSILVSQYLLMNNGEKLNSLSIIAGTICKTKNRYNLACTDFSTIKKYSNTIADGICEYFSYVDLLNNKITA